MCWILPGSLDLQMTAGSAAPGGVKSVHTIMRNKPIYIGCDDSGYEAKLHLLELFEVQKLSYVDCGSGKEPSRYPYYAAKVAQAVSLGKAIFGSLLCGSGIGMSIAANKFPGVRAAAVSDSYSARLTRRHNDSNVLCLGGGLMGAWQIEEIVKVWLGTEYDAGHHEPSLALIRDIEARNMSGELWCPENTPYSPFLWNPEQEL